MEDVNGALEFDGGDKGAPPPPSPLTGCYLLIVVGEPHCSEHKDVILQRLAKGLLSWDVNDCLVDLEKELAVITEQALEGEEARCGERLIQFASENLVTEILIHPVVSTLAQCVRNLLSSFTRHRHIIHSGYTFANNGSWILQDGTFSLADFTEAFQEIEVLRVIRAYENGISLDIHCAPEGDWTRLPKECKGCKVRVNPNDVLTSGSPSITNFVNYIEPFLIPAKLENVLESSDVVGNIRFSRPTLYVFPGGQGDAALFGINGFNMLLDGGFSRKACFWDFVRHLDRLDAVLLTRLNNSNVNGISAVLRRKMQNAVYPQIGHFFCNLQEKKTILSPDGDKDKDPLLINLLEEGQEVISNLRHLGLTPQVCYRDSEPINLYHKVGHGTLDMYVLSPAKDSKEVREFLQRWNNNDQRLFANQKSKDFVFPLQNLVSICALLVWQPANPDDTITRILFPGSSPQNKIFEGIEKIKSLEFIKHPVCSEKTLAPVSVVKTKQSVLIASLEKKKVPEKALDNMLNENDLKNDLKNDQMKNNIQPEKIVKKSDSTDSEKSVSKPKKEDDKPKTTTTTTTATKPKIETKPKLRSDSQQRKKTVEKKASPTTPKKTFEKINGDKKLKPKASPGATPAKSAKEATNRKLESKIKAAPPKKEVKPSEKKEAKEFKEPKDAKFERKPISRRPRDIKSSPSRKMVNGKPDSIQRRQGKFDKEGTTDSSTVSTPSADQESVLKKDISKLTSEELQNLKADELADLKEEQEAVKEIEAVFRKGELHQDTSDFRKIKNISIDDKESEEYLIIEKTEVEADSTKEDEIQKHTRDSEESEKLRKLSSEVQKEEVKDIVVSEAKKLTSATEAVKSQEAEEAPKEVSATSPEDKIDVSAKDKDNEDKEVVPESQPDEKGSTNIESGATTTAPTLPEDERIPLDEIKEDYVDQPVEEKHVKEDTKEKDIPVIQLPPKPFDTISKLPPVVGIRLDKQSHIRDIVKTPDEVADLPVHEEVDYEDYQDSKPSDSKDAQKESDDSSKPSDDSKDKKVETPEKDEEQIEKPRESDVKPIKIDKNVVEPKLEEIEVEAVDTQEEVKKSIELEVAEEEKELKDKETKKEKERFDDEKDKDDNELHKEDAQERDGNLNIEKTTTSDAELTCSKDGLKDTPETLIVDVKATITVAEIPPEKQEESKVPVPLLLKEELVAIIEDPIHAAVPENAVESVKEDVNSIFQLDEKLQKLKEEVEAKEKAAIHEIITLERQVKEPEHPEPVIISPGSPSSPETQEKRRSLEEEKAELGRKSPKEREEDVIKIVASVAEVLKSDAPLEEFEGKIPFSIPYKSITTELRETHITTVESPLTEEPRGIIHSEGISTILEEPIKEKEVEETRDVIEEETEEKGLKEAKGTYLEENKEKSKQEDAEKMTEDKGKEEGSKISKLMKDSNEIMEASSKIISNIKESQSKTDEKDEHDVDASTVHRMLVTASSEDGGEEIEICPPGTITFSRSSESSGRSSPDPLSQKLSQKSSTFDTFSSDVTMVKTADVDHQGAPLKDSDKKSEVPIEYEVPITVGDNKNKPDLASKDEEPEKSDSRKPSLDSEKMKDVNKMEETLEETNKIHELLAEISAEKVLTTSVAVPEDAKSEKETSVIKDDAKAQPSSSLKRDSINDHDENGVVENATDQQEPSAKPQAEAKDIRDVEMRKDSGSFIDSQVPDKSTSVSSEDLKDKSSGKVTPTDKGLDSLTRVTDDVVILSSDSNGIDQSSISSSTKGSPLPASPFKASEVDSGKSSPLVDNFNDTKVETSSEKSSPALVKKDISGKAAPLEEAGHPLEVSTSAHELEQVQSKEDSGKSSPVGVKDRDSSVKSTSVIEAEEIMKELLVDESGKGSSVDKMPTVEDVKERKDSLGASYVPEVEDDVKAESEKASPSEKAPVISKTDSDKSSPELEVKDQKQSSGTPPGLPVEVKESAVSGGVSPKKESGESSTEPEVKDDKKISGTSPVPPPAEVKEIESGTTSPVGKSPSLSKKDSGTCSPIDENKGSSSPVPPFESAENSEKWTPFKASGALEPSKEIASDRSSPLGEGRRPSGKLSPVDTVLPLKKDSLVSETLDTSNLSSVDVKEKGDSIDASPKVLSGKSSPASLVDNGKMETVDVSPKELSGKSSPALPIDVNEKRKSLDASPKELSGKSSPGSSVEVKDQKESIDASPKELSRKSSLASPVDIKEEKESKDACQKQFSGKTSPVPPVDAKEKRDSIDASPKELSGKSSPAPSVDVKEKRESIDASPEKISGEASPTPPVDVKGERESIDTSPKELSRKSSPVPLVDAKEKRESIDVPPKELSGKASPAPPVDAKDKRDSVDTSPQELSGELSPSSRVVDKEKRESVGASPKELSGKSSPAPPIDVKDKRESIDVSPKELPGKSSPSPPVDLKERKESIDTSPKESSGKASPAPPVDTKQKRDSIDVSPKELTGKSSPAPPVDLKERKESIDTSPKESSGKASPAPPVDTKQKRDSIDVSPKELSGKSSPSSPVDLKERKESIDISPKESSGKASPAPPVDTKQKRDSIDVSPKELSGKSSPSPPVDLKERKESTDTSPKRLSGKSSPASSVDVKEKRESKDASSKELYGEASSAPPVDVNGKRESIDASPKELSGKSSPAPLVDVKEKRESIDASQTELFGKASPASAVDSEKKKDSVDASPKELSGKSSPVPPVDLKKKKKKESIDASPKELSGKSSPAPPVEVKEMRDSVDVSPKELPGNISPAPPVDVKEKRDSIDVSPKELSGKVSPAPLVQAEEKRKSIDASPKELSGKSSPIPSIDVKEKKESIDASPKELSGKASPAPPADVKEKRESIDALPQELAGKSSPVPQVEAKEKWESVDASSKDLSGRKSPTSPFEKTSLPAKSTAQEIQAKEEQSGKATLAQDMNGVLPGKSSPEHIEIVDANKADTTKTEVPKSTVDSNIHDEPKVSESFKDKATLDVEHVSEKKLSISDVEVSLIPEVSKSTVSKGSSRTSTPDLRDSTDSFLKHEILDCAITHLIQTSSEHLSGKSTPDIAEVEHQKEIQETLKHEKHIPGSSTPPTVPVSPIVKHQKVEEPIVTTLTSLKEGEIRSSTPSDCEVPVSTHSDLSSEQFSGAPHYLENEPVESDDDNLPGSPMSVTSQVAHSRSSSHYDFDDDRVLPKMDPMATSFYGSLPDEPEGSFLDEADLDFEKAMAEHRKSRGEDLVEPSSSSYLYEITKAKFTSSSDSDNANLTEHSTLDQINKNGHSTVDNVMTASFIGTELPSSSDTKKDAIGTWGKPLGLPSPAPPSNNKQGTPKKERKLPANVSVKNKLNEKRSDSPSKYKNKKLSPIYVDLSYVPHHGNAYYSYIDFFKRVRARYYVFSGIEPSREVYNALLEAKQTWEDNELEVTIIPTYDTDILGYWVAENEELLTKYKIDLSPSASRCTINLQDHETSCSAYRLEF